ncbi:MAG: hypothetical protein HY648_13815 [Acidobacteria bacterium]|nr:hypothetical protein [Acidobacteriota bacterium]
MKKEKRRNRFVLCVQNNGCDDLELRKVYQVIPDSEAAAEGYLRVIDESGEDYLYPASCFTPIELSTEAAKILAAAR